MKNEDYTAQEAAQYIEEYMYNLNNSNRMKTSKVKKVAGEPKAHTNSYGTTFYHNLEMDNGDKINIGKKHLLTEGAELTYEIIEHGQQEYNKAKNVNPNYTGPTNGGNNKPSNGGNTKQFKADPERAKSIELQSMAKLALDFHNSVGFETTDKGQQIVELASTAIALHKYIFVDA